MGGKRRRLFWDLSSLAFGQSLSMVLGFVAFAYLARTLSPESYGLVEYAVGLAGLAAFVIDGGLGPLGALRVSRDREHARELAGRIIAARLLLAVAVVPLVGLAAAGQEPRAVALIGLFALSLFAAPFKQEWLLQGLERMNHVAAALVLRAAVFAVGALLVVRGSSDLLRIGFVELTAAFVTAGYYLAAQRSAGVPVRVYVDRLPILALIRTGASIGASNAIWPLMLYLPIFLVANMVGTAEAGWLGAAQRIVAALVSFSALYFFNLFPTMARGLKEDRARWEAMMESSFRIIAWASIGFSMMVASAADVIIVLVFGDAFSVAAPVFAILIWLLPLRLLSGHSRWTLLAGERQELLLVAEVLGTATILACGLALTPKWGAPGAATAVLLGNVVCWVAAHVLAGRHVGRLPGVRETLPPVAAALASAAIARVFEDYRALSLAAAAITYAVCLRFMVADVAGDVRRLAYTERHQMASRPDSVRIMGSDAP